MSLTVHPLAVRVHSHHGGTGAPGACRADRVLRGDRIPIARLIVLATEQLTAPGCVGGCSTPLWQRAGVDHRAGVKRLFDMVRASIGAILANLCGLGSRFSRGLRYRDQKYNPARGYSSMMLIAVSV